MKGLLLKDFYVIWKDFRIYFFMAFVFLAVSLFNQGDNLLFLTFPMVLMGGIPITLIGEDERSRWNVYSMTLPVTRTQQVSCRYCVALIGIGAMLLLSFALHTVRLLVLRAGVEAMGAMIMQLVLPAAVVLVCPSVMLPLVIHLGTEKGRIAYYIIVGVICGGATALSIGGKVNISGVSAAVIALFFAALFAASWVLSCAIVQRR